MKVAEKIELKIKQFKPGNTFKYRELGIDALEYNAAAKALERLIAKGTIKRVSTGVFYKPKETVFGQLKPSEEELLKSYLFENNKRIAFITGNSLFNKFGLTTQVPKTIKVASLSKRIDTTIGSIRVKPVKSYIEVSDNNYFFLEILEVLKDFKLIPDNNKSNSIKIIATKINNLSIEEKKILIKLALKYPPRVKALLGAIMQQSDSSLDTSSLAKAMNPLTEYEIGLNEKILPTAPIWHIK